MDITTRLKQLEDLVAEAKSMPLSSSVLVNREEFLEVLEGIRETLPEEIKQARWVVKDREELLTKARRDAEALIEEAQQEQKRMASREEVAKRAVQEADAILSEAREESRRVQHESEDWVDARLASFEVAIGRLQEALSQTLEEVAGLQERLAKTTQQVEAGRQRLRGGTIAEEELASEPEGADR